MTQERIEQQTEKIESDEGDLVGKEFLNQVVLVQYRGNGESLTVPHKEAWLYQNERALALVQQGLDEAQSGEFSTTPPNLQESFSFAEQLLDE